MTETTAAARPDDESFANQDEILLGVLTAIDRDANTSQRTISRELDVALGLANSYLKRCVRKGLIKIQQVPRRRYVYYLTPQGFSEKARLTSQYLSASFTFFRRARSQMSELMGLCERNGWRRVAFAGVSELAEVGTMCARDFKIEIVGIVDAKAAGSHYAGLPVHADWARAGTVDAVIVTDLTASARVRDALFEQIGVERTLVPGLLRIALPRSQKGDAKNEAATAP